MGCELTTATLKFVNFVYKLTIMTTITLKINDKSTAGKSFLPFLKTFVVKDKSVEIVSTPVVKEKSPYNPEFVKKITSCFFGF